MAELFMSSNRRRPPPLFLLSGGRRKRLPLSTSSNNPFVERLGETVVTRAGQEERIFFERVRRVPGLGEKFSRRSLSRLKTSFPHATQARQLFAHALRLWQGYFPHEERQPIHMFRAGLRDTRVFQTPRPLTARRPYTYPIIIARSEKGKVIGFSTMLHFPGAGALGEYLVVQPEYRRFGVGKKLMEHRFDVLRKEGARHVFIEVEPLTAENIRRKKELESKAALNSEEQRELGNLNDRISRLEIFSKTGYLAVDPNRFHHYHTLSADPSQRGDLGTRLVLLVKGLAPNAEIPTALDLERFQKEIYGPQAYNTPGLGKLIRQKNRDATLRFLGPEELIKRAVAESRNGRLKGLHERRNNQPSFL